MKHLRSVIKIIVVGFFAVVLLLAIFPLAQDRSLPRANADSLDAYPSVCLGGWENPGNAAGAPDVAPGGTSFTDQNSAVLNGEQAQIFCGSFQAGDQSQTPTAVTLSFSWNVVFASQESSSGNTDTNTDSAEWSSVLDTTSTVTSTPDQSVATSSEVSASSSTDGTDASSSVDQSSTSFLQNIFSDPFAFLVERSFADTTGTDGTTIDTSTPSSTDDASTTIDTSTTIDDSSADAGDDFMDVSYSLDGTTWTDLGQVNASGWQNYSVTIPVNSWSEINALQVQLSPDIGADEPTVYLDGMSLEIDYNQSILGDLENAASATINVVSNLSDSVDNALTDLLSPPTTTPQPQQPTPQPSTTPAPPSPPPPPTHQYSFVLQGPQSIKVGNLAWDPETASGSASSAVSQSGSAPTVSLPATNTIQISGPCSSAYYTILIFPDADDYETNPSLALYNEANQCVSGNFTQTISDLDLPPQLASGTYYLIVANQGTKGPWVPDPEIYPIQLSATSNSTSSSQ